MEEAIALEKELIDAISWDLCPWCAMPDLNLENEKVLSCRSCCLEIQLPHLQAKQWLENNKAALQHHAQTYVKNDFKLGILVVTEARSFHFKKV